MPGTRDEPTEPNREGAAGERKAAHGPFRRAGYRLLAALLGLSIALLLGELGVRLLGIGPTLQVVHAENFQLSDDPILQYELRPGSPDGDSSINAAGYRGPERDRGKTAGTFRIVAVGDSVTFGLEVAEADAYPAQLEEKLRASAGPGAPSFEVLNLGVTGYNIAQNVEQIRARGLALEPDLVVYGYVLNDPQEYSFEGAALANLLADAERGYRRPTGEGIRAALAKSRLFLLARHALSDAPVRDPERAAAATDPGYVARAHGELTGYFHAIHLVGAGRDRLIDGMEQLGQLSRQRRVPVLVAIFPLLLEEEGGDYPLRDIHRLVAAQAAAHGLASVDLLPVYEEARQRYEEELLSDFMHPNELGYELAAGAILEALLRLDLLPAGSLESSRQRRWPWIVDAVAPEPAPPRR